MSAVVPTPLLRVACDAQRGRPSSGGRLVIAPGAVRFEFHAAAVELGLPPVIHARPPLVFVRARLLPPGFSSALILHGDEGTVTVFTWCGLRARVLRALAEAEVAFVERVTWVSIGAAARPTAAADAGTARPSPTSVAGRARTRHLGRGPRARGPGAVK